jgi:hypothetical protein
MPSAAGGNDAGMSDLHITPDDASSAEVEEEREGFIDKLRHSGVGTEDPNIVGDAGPTDIPPGSDGDSVEDALAGEADPEAAPPE